MCKAKTGHASLNLTHRQIQKKEKEKEVILVI